MRQVLPRRAWRLCTAGEAAVLPVSMSAFDFSLPLTDERIEALVYAVAAGDVADENEALEWKRKLDLSKRPQRAQTARQLIGFANRDPADALRWFGGHACLLLGVEPGEVTGMHRVDSAVLDDRLRPYTGDRLRWSGHYVAAGDRHVLALVVDAPRRRDPVYQLQKGSADESGRELPAGTVFVRKGGRTVRADEADIERLLDRAEVLRVEPIWNAGQSGDWIGVRAMNPPGAKDTAITQVGFILGPAAVSWAPEGVDPEADDAPQLAGEMLMELHNYEPPHAIRAAERIDTKVVPARIPFGMDVSSTYVPFVVDIQGHRLTGRPIAFFELLIGAGWQPDSSLPDPLTRMGISVVGPVPDHATISWLDTAWADTESEA